MKRVSLRVGTAVRKLAWEGERLRWRLFHPVTVGARVILIRDRQVLLIRHTYREGWFFPGGGVDKGEPLDEAARREAEEEANATLHELTLLGVYSNFDEGKSDHLAMFSSRDFPLRPLTPNNEIAARVWFAIDSLPADISAGVRERIEELIAGGPPRAGAW